MALRNVITISEENLLRRVSRPVTEFDARLAVLLDDMRETLKAQNGAGLAAPQIGILRRAVLCDLDGKIVEMMNPVITAAKGEEDDVEGCLSVPGKRGRVVRPAALTVTAQDRHGKPFKVKVKGYAARVVCHEVDHLDGILYTDKARSIEVVKG